ncbi:hypothetical protein DNL40_04165 [Xylanimonas oleitrophica]|uniref:Flagellar protein n=1 Tax=Xylanimonas oleitrophica TaxID=2607479 RepID=A0A2W5XUW0_9MICO|nr:flagellar biosynthetic protein FliO [Xylanimonas oleitrophica]PZR54138.1 hypothetical protein DNL40_04165 [Xylanimonas oleitrophica]
MGDAVMLLLRVVLSLGVVLLLIWYLGRRLGQGRAPATGEHEVRVVARQPLGRHAGVAVLGIGERRLLVGFGEQQVSLLGELDAVAAPAAVAGDVVGAEDGTVTGAGVVAPPWLPVPVPALAGARAPRHVAASVPDDGAGGSPLAGSVLDPHTWRRAVRAVQERTVRR